MLVPPALSSTPLLRIDHVAKAFRAGPPWRTVRTPVLEDVSLSVDGGELVVLLGANGAGKTTLLKIVASLVVADRGEVEISGRAAGGPIAKTLVGYASGEERYLFFRLTGRENLRFFGALYGLDRRTTERRIGELAEELAAHMAAEERTFLSPAALHDDVIRRRTRDRTPELA